MTTPASPDTSTGTNRAAVVPSPNCPVLFIRGEAKLGAVMTDGEVSWVKQNFSNVYYAQINGVGHLLHLQDQGQTPVLTEMMTFLELIPK